MVSRSLVLAVLLGCGSGALARHANVFDEDRREDWDYARVERGSIGRVGWGCTGFQAGSRIVVTAAHCTLSSDTTTYRPHGGSSVDATVLRRGMNYSPSQQNQHADDWAILLLDRATGDSSINVTSYSASDFSSYVSGRRAWMVGYSSDRSGLSVDSHCSVRDRYAGLVLHDCDLTGGASGGPIFVLVGGVRRVIGIQSGQGNCGSGPCAQGIPWSNATSNVAVDASSFIHVLISYLNQYP